MQPAPPFPPHWFTIYRAGTIIGANLQPANCLVQATSWRLYPDSLRTSDLIGILEALAKEPANCSLVVAYVDTIDSAHYLMEAARVALAAFDDATRDRLFGSPVVPPTEADKPRPALPPGHPDSFSMDDLRAELERCGVTLPAPLDVKATVAALEHYQPPSTMCGAPYVDFDGVTHRCDREMNHTETHRWRVSKPPVPFGTDHQFPQGKKPTAEAIQICGHSIASVGVCRKPDGHAGDHYYEMPQ